VASSKKGNILNLIIIVIISIFFILLSMKSVSMYNSDNKFEKTFVENKNRDLLLYGNEEKYILLSEDFEEGLIPPAGWKGIVNNSNYSWEIGNNNFHEGKYSAKCLNDIQNNHQDEWIVTPILDLRGYSAIYLSFWWFLSYYWAVSPYDFYDLNVKISIDGGTNWTLIWSENSLTPFENWNWYNTSFGKHIDLSRYNDKKNISIGFQYFGKNGAQLNIDDIVIYGEKSENFPVIDAGGPYNAFVNETIEFQSTVNGGTWPYKYDWDFGNGDKSKLRHPTYNYDRPDEYTVRLNITDFNGNIAHDFTKATIINMSKRPQLIIDNITGLDNVSALLLNKGTENAINVTWEITIKGGFLNIINTVSRGNFTCIGCNCSKIIHSRPFNGFGLIKINIMANAQNAERMSRKIIGLIFNKNIIILPL